MDVWLRHPSHPRICVRMRILCKSTSAQKLKHTWPQKFSDSTRSSPRIPEYSVRPTFLQHGSSNAICGAQSAVCEGLDKACEEVYQARQKRVLKDCHGHSYRICHHGLHWFLCQTHPHPYQQYHCWWLNISCE